MTTKRRDSKHFAEGIEEGVKAPPQKLHQSRFDKVLSTGSTLLDLAISGGRVRGGGLPAGIYVEYFGPPSCGKTLLLIENAGSILKQGGEVHYDDGERRFDKEYSRIMGVNIPEENYTQSHTVIDLMDNFKEWSPESKEINGFFEDSIASLSSDWEMEDKDEYGMRKAKLLHKFFRTNKTSIEKNNWIVAYSNQTIGGPSGDDTPGGKAIKYWSSLRIRIGPHPKNKWLKATHTMPSKYKAEKKFGRRSMCRVIKSSCDDEGREAPISIVYGYGVDDLRENLQYNKEVTCSDKFDCVSKEFSRIEMAIEYVEESDLVGKIREKTIDLWEEIEQAFKDKRKRVSKQRR